MNYPGDGRSRNDGHRLSGDGYQANNRHSGGRHSASKGRMSNVPYISQSDLAAYKTSNYVGRGDGRKHDHKRRNIIIAVVVAVVLVLGCCGVAAAMSIKDAKADASTLMTQGKELMTQLKSGDKAQAEKTAADLSATAQKLKGNVDGPIWTVASLVPGIGGDVSQVRTLASIADTLCAQTLPPVIQTMPEGGLSGLMVDGGVNANALTTILTALGNEYDSIHACAQQASTLGDPHLEQLKDPVETVKSLLGTLDTVSQYSGELAQVLPGMLGADGTPSTYLLTAANNAEPRPRGGMPGSFAVMTVTDGKISVGGFAGADAAPRLEAGSEASPVITDEEVQIFGTRVGLDIRDTSFIPNFPRAAELEAALWTATGNAPVDGVIMLDPVFLQRLLAITGGVTTSDGTAVDGGNAAQQLMNEVYLRYPDAYEAQDAFFAEVASLALGQVINNLGEVNPVKLLEVIATAVKENRLNIWMANSEEETMVIKLGAGGQTSTSETDPVAGIYFGAPYGTKSGWYLDVDASVGDGRKNADGSMSYDISLTLTNTLSEELASSLPYYITGNDPLKASDSDMPLDIFLYAPAGGSISNMQTDGYFFNAAAIEEAKGSWHGRVSDEALTKASYNGSEVWYGTARIAGTTSTRITYTVTTSPQATSALELDVTPLANENI